MDVNKLTQKTQEAIQNAQNIAARLQQVELDVEHVLMALLEQADGLIPRILAKMDIPVDTVVSEVHKELERRPRVSGPGAEAGKIYVTQRFNKMLVRAKEEAARLKDVGLHEALANLDDRSRAIVQRRWLTEGDAATLHELAAEYGVSAERIRQIEAKAMQKMRTQLAALA